MTRQEKYPDTRTFHFYNANPKNKFTGDCVVRALCVAMDKSYEDVYRELLEHALKTGYSVCSTENYDRYLQSHGWFKQKQPRKLDNTKYTGKEFCEEVQNNCARTGAEPARAVANIGGHHVVAIVDGKVWDTWNSTDGCIGNYWVRGDLR